MLSCVKFRCWKTRTLFLSLFLLSFPCSEDAFVQRFGFGKYCRLWDNIVLTRKIAHTWWCKLVKPRRLFSSEFWTMNQMTMSLWPVRRTGMVTRQGTHKEHVTNNKAVKSDRAFLLISLWSDGNKQLRWQSVIKNCENPPCNVRDWRSHKWALLRIPSTSPVAIYEVTSSRDCLDRFTPKI